MAANKPPHGNYVVDCPPPRHVTSWWGQATPPAPARQELNPACRRRLRIFSWILLAAAVITGLVLMGVFLARAYPTGDPVFTVAVAGVAGLGPVAAGGGGAVSSPLSPVFNLTLHVDNKRNSEYRACIPGVSSASVSYGDAFLARGSVPPFCARKMHESEPMAARAWGNGVVLPQFLWDQMAGEMAAGDAAVDVKVSMPRYCAARGRCYDALLTCKAKIIGGGASPPCRLDYVHAQEESQGKEDTPVIVYMPNPIPGMPLIPIFT